MAGKIRVVPRPDEAYVKAALQRAKKSKGGETYVEKRITKVNEKETKKKRR